MVNPSDVEKALSGERDLKGADLSNAILIDVKMLNSKLDNTKLKNVILINTELPELDEKNIELSINKEFTNRRI